MDAVLAAAIRWWCCRPAAASRSASRRRRSSREGLAIVVSPLISLMKDQVDALVGNGVAAACYNSSLPSEQQRDVSPACATASCGCSTSRPSGWWATAATASCRCSGAAGQLRRRSTRRTASASGATISGRSTGSWRACASAGRASACTRTRPRRPRACGATSSRSSGCATPTELVGSFDRPNLVYRVLPRVDVKEQILDVLERAPRRGRHRLLPVAQGSRRAGAVAARTGWRARAVPRRAGRRGAASQPGRVPERRGRRRRGDGGVRHGHRPIGRALRHSRRRAAVARALSAGIRPRRPRRPRSRVRADRLGRRLPEVAR